MIKLIDECNKSVESADQSTVKHQTINRSIVTRTHEAIDGQINEGIINKSITRKFACE